MLLFFSSVQKFGTEDRQVEQFIPPSDSIIPVMSFHAHDIAKITISENV